jgi:pimeloyl-ACP methyl ester carboxylesterase
LIFSGSKDPDFKDPAAEGEAQRQQLKNAKTVRVEVLPDLGHYPAAENPEALFELATAFLESTS